MQSGIEHVNTSTAKLACNQVLHSVPATGHVYAEYCESDYDRTLLWHCVCEPNPLQGGCCGTRGYLRAIMSKLSRCSPRSLIHDPR